MVMVQIQNVTVSQIYWLNYEAPDFNRPGYNIVVHKCLLAALQPYKSSCPWIKRLLCNFFFQLLSFVIKTKVVQNVNRMSEKQKDRPTDSQTDRQKDRQTERQLEDKTTFQLSYQNKSCSECQQDVRKIERQAERQTDRRTDRQKDR